MTGYSFTKHADRQLRQLSSDLQRRIILKIKHYISTGDPLHFDGHILVTRLGHRARIY